MNMTVDLATHRLTSRQWFLIMVNVLGWALLLPLTFGPSGTSGPPTWAVVSFPILYLVNLIAIFYARTWLVRIPQLIFALAGLPMAAISGFIILLWLEPPVMP